MTYITLHYFTLHYIAYITLYNTILLVYCCCFISKLYYKLYIDICKITIQPPNVNEWMNHHPALYLFTVWVSCVSLLVHTVWWSEGADWTVSLHQQSRVMFSALATSLSGSSLLGLVSLTLNNSNRPMERTVRTP